MCYVPDGSTDTFIMHTAGLFSTFGARTRELEIRYTVVSLYLSVFLSLSSQRLRRTNSKSVTRSIT